MNTFFIVSGIVTSGLIGYWDAGYLPSYPTTGTILYNVAGTSGGTGTLTNGPTYSSNNGGSIVYDGTNDYVDLGNYANLGSEPFSISAWFKYTSN